MLFRSANLLEKKLLASGVGDQLERTGATAQVWFTSTFQWRNSLSSFAEPSSIPGPRGSAHGRTSLGWKCLWLEYNTLWQGINRFPRDNYCRFLLWVSSFCCYVLAGAIHNFGTEPVGYRVDVTLTTSYHIDIVGQCGVGRLTLSLSVVVRVTWRR